MKDFHLLAEAKSSAGKWSIDIYLIIFSLIDKIGFVFSSLISKRHRIKRPFTHRTFNHEIYTLFTVIVDSTGSACESKVGHFWEICNFFFVFQRKINSQHFSLTHWPLKGLWFSTFKVFNFSSNFSNFLLRTKTGQLILITNNKLW